jgi:transportin-1
LDSEELGRPLNAIIPKFIDMFLHPKDAVRKYTLGAVNIFLYMMPQALVMNIDKYMTGLFRLTSDTNKEIRKRVCQAFVVLLEVRFDYLQPHMDNVIKYMLHATTDEDESVALEACEFWAAYCETKVIDLEHACDNQAQTLNMVGVNRMLIYRY